MNIQNNYFDDFVSVFESLKKHRVEYILIGGVAVILYGLERFTGDLDIFIKPTRDNIRKLRESLFSVFEDSAVEEITFQELSEYAVIRYGTPNGFYIDIMTRIGEAAVYDDLEYEVAEYMGTSINIATPETLLRLKQDTVRHKDKADAIFLRELIQYRKSAQYDRKEK
ncbi:MAG TPA: hypothetical protein ENK58_09940 [Desulfobacterales bacterium]|nr:hypothetical protein [Desulfobacterales bacterium]